MAGIGVSRTRTLLADVRGTRIGLNVVEVRRGKTSGATQDVYADGSQDVIEGFSTTKTIRVRCERLSAADMTQIDEWVGEVLLFGGVRNITFVGLLDDFNIVQRADQDTGLEYNVSLIFILVNETVNEFLARAALSG